MPIQASIYSFDLERKVLQRVLLISAFVIFVYFVYDLFNKVGQVNWISSIIIMSIYLGCFFMVKYSSNFILVRRICFAFITLSMLGSFFNLGGLNGIGVLDISSMFALITLLFDGKERMAMVFIYLVITGFFCFVQGFHPEWIHDRNFDQPWFDVIEVLLRFLTAFNLGYTMKTEYGKEFKQIQLMNLELKEMNEEISSQNEEIAQQREEIILINENLEVQIEARTKKVKEQNGKLMEYAFFNAHKVRGPLARILGLVNVTKLISAKDEKEQYIALIEESAIELDNVVKEINELLSESDRIAGTEQ